VQSFGTAYALIKDTIADHTPAKLQPPKGAKPVAFDCDTELAWFLPSSAAGKGLTSFAVAWALAELNNVFLREAAKVLGHELDTREAVSIASVHQSNLAGLDTERELLPLVLQHCTFKVQYQEGTHISYDFDEIQWQLQERLVHSSRLVSMASLLAAKKFTYSTDLCNNESFEQVRAAIPQLSLEMDTVVRIIDELVAKTKLAEAVDNLETAISFLAAASVHRSPTQPLNDYLQQALLLPENAALVECEAARGVELQHVLVLWQRCELQLALDSFHTAAMDPFPALPTKLPTGAVAREPLTPPQVKAIRTALTQTAPDNRLWVLAELREFVLLRLSSADYRDANPEHLTADYMLQYLVEHTDAKGTDDDVGADAPGIDEMEWLTEQVNWPDDDAPKMTQATAIWEVVAKYHLGME
jgi:hypothetical protein